MLYTEKNPKKKKLKSQLNVTEAVILKILVCLEFTSFDVFPAKYSLMVICFSELTSSLIELWKPAEN